MVFMCIIFSRDLTSILQHQLQSATGSSYLFQLFLEIEGEELEDRGPSFFPERDMASMSASNRVNTTSEITVQVGPQVPEPDYDDNSSDSDNGWRNPGDELMQSLPSHSYKAIRGLPPENTYKGNIRRSLRSRSPRTGASSRTTVDNEVESVHSDEFNENDVFGSLSPDEYAEAVQRRNKSIKEIPTTIRRKRTLR